MMYAYGCSFVHYICLDRPQCAKFRIETVTVDLVWHNAALSNILWVYIHKFRYNLTSVKITGYFQWMPIKCTCIAKCADPWPEKEHLPFSITPTSGLSIGLWQYYVVIYLVWCLVEIIKTSHGTYVFFVYQHHCTRFHLHSL